MRIASSVFDMSGGHITECVSLSRRSRIHAAAKRDIETISSSTNGQVQVPAASLMDLSLSEHCRVDEYAERWAEELMRNYDATKPPRCLTIVLDFNALRPQFLGTVCR